MNQSSLNLEGTGMKLTIEARNEADNSKLKKDTFSFDNNSNV